MIKKGGSVYLSRLMEIRNLENQTNEYRNDLQAHKDHFIQMTGIKFDSGPISSEDSTSLHLQ